MTPLPRFANLALKRCSDNRELAFSMSAARVRTAVGPLPNRPVDPAKALVPVERKQ